MPKVLLYLPPNKETNNKKCIPTFENIDTPTPELKTQILQERQINLSLSHEWDQTCNQALTYRALALPTHDGAL